MSRGGLRDGRFQIERQGRSTRTTLSTSMERKRMVPLRRPDGKSHVIGRDRGCVMEGSAFGR